MVVKQLRLPTFNFLQQGVFGLPFVFGKKLHPSIKQIPWKELLPFHESENLFLVDISIEPELFLQVLSDDSQSYLQEWIRDGLVVCPLPDEVEAWNLKEGATFPTIQVGEMAFVLIEV